MSRARRPPHAIARVEKPWGWELRWAHTERYVGKILHINRGGALSYQFHRRKDETIYVLRGQLTLEYAPNGGRRRRRHMGPGDGIRIWPGDRHRMTAITACDVLEASTPELDDLVRLEDRYGRADGLAPAARRRTISARPRARGRAGARAASPRFATPIGPRPRSGRAHGGLK